MNSTRRQQIEDLFEAVLDRSSEDRAAFLAEACGADTELRAEVEALLAGHDMTGSTLDQPVAKLAASWLGERVAERRIGPYRVLRELGRGGMGVVYLAERDDGQFRRRVAIKLVRSGLDDGQIHRRFLAERQILASLNHPNIAQLLDGGMTDGRLPYLVMEYVAGLPITDYCDRHRLGIEARLRLFQDVCDAVHHAHQNLVIHRDLKPSNILVTEAGQVKLLDFGIAKLLNPSLGPADVPFTRIEHWVMTPEYASPEQVRGDSLTTASDVYALGVILYELLTGHQPYHLTTRSPERVLELVCERDPERPSTRAGQTEIITLQDGTVQKITPALVSAVRDLPVERLPRKLRGDLDAIVMMALRKEPGRRYGSAELLAQDIQRHLEGQPVQAHSGSRVYRLRKFLWRHRVETVAAAVVGMSLLVGTGIASWQAVVAGHERDRAELSRVEAERALAQSEEVTRFLMAMFEAADPDPDRAAASNEVTARDLLRRGLARADDLAQYPEVQARMLDVIGQIYARLGYYDEAERLLGQAIEIRRRVLGPNSLELTYSLIHLSWVHRSRSELDEARRLVSEALEIRRRTLPPDHPEVAAAIQEVGRVAATNPDQERLYREALGILQRTGADPAGQVQLLNSLTTNVRRQGRLAEAVATNREALRLAEQQLGPEHFRTGYAMIHLADQVRDIEQNFAEAERLYRRGLELMTRHYGDNHLELIHGLGSLGRLQSQLGNHAEAELLLRRSLEIRREALGPDHPVVAGSLLALAEVLERQGRLAEAEAYCHQAFALVRRLLRGPDHWVVAGLTRLSSIRLRQQRFEEADSLYQEALSTRLALQQGQAVRTAEERRTYGRMLTGHRHFQRAEEQLLESLAILQKAYPAPDHPNTQETKRALMELYQAWGRPELVERYHVPPGTFVPY